MSDLFLVAHKVRGEPAFDVACRIQIGDEEGWIIPTSGHRAHPYWTMNLNQLMYRGANFTAEMPTDWPDHYACNDRPPPKQSLSATILEALGLRKPTEPIKRRV